AGQMEVFVGDKVGLAQAKFRADHAVQPTERLWGSPHTLLNFWADTSEGNTNPPRGFSMHKVENNFTKANAAADGFDNLLQKAFQWGSGAQGIAQTQHCFDLPGAAGCLGLLPNLQGFRVRLIGRLREDALHIRVPSFSCPAHRAYRNVTLPGEQ